MYIHIEIVQTGLLFLVGGTTTLEDLELNRIDGHQAQG